MLEILVGMHGAAEDHVRVVRRGRRASAAERPLVQRVARLLEQLRPCLRRVDDRQDSHSAFTSSSLRSRNAPSAACEMRPSGLFGSTDDELLLKNAYASFASPARSCRDGAHSSSSSSEYR